MARKTKRPEALRAWCTSLADAENWEEALRAYDAAAELVGKTSHWRGEFLDGAALAAHQLARSDREERLETAWIGAPSLIRLLRWLGAGEPANATLVNRAKEALDRCPRKAAQQLGLLSLVTGDFGAGAKLLTKAPGLGWSSPEHPGHLLFPAFARLLANGSKAALSTELFAGLDEVPKDPLDFDLGDKDSAKPKLATPAVTKLLNKTTSKIDTTTRSVLLKAMQAAATKRVEGILGNKRRRHYDHAATLVACCLELAAPSGDREKVTAWVADLRKQYARFRAFQGELKRALAAASR